MFLRGACTRRCARAAISKCITWATRQIRRRESPRTRRAGDVIATLGAGDVYQTGRARCCKRSAHEVKVA